MRRTVSYILLGLGVFAVALGLLLRFYAYPQLAKLPLDQESTSVAQGEGITALVIRTVDGAPVPEIRENLNLTSTTYVTGDLTQPEVEEGGDIGVYVEAIRTVDNATGIVVNASVRELCVDRFTNEAVAPCEAQYVELEQDKRIQGERDEVQQPGQSFKFPFGTEQRTYKYYDLTSQRSVDAEFQGEEDIQGVDVYRFVMEVPPTKIGTREVTGELVGQPDEPSLTADLYYQVKRTVWVEPETGIIIRGEQTGKQELLLEGEEPGEGTTVFDGTLGFNEVTVNDNVDRAEETMGRLEFLTFWPIVMWIGGAVLILAAVAMLVLGGGSSSAGGNTDRVPLRRRQPAAT